VPGSSYTNASGINDLGQIVGFFAPAAAEKQLWHDLQPLLDTELSRLPPKYRAVIVLCDLEGKTRIEAARLLGVPEGTVAGWLARARVMLAKRLARRGLVVSSGSLAVVVSQSAGSASVPPSLLVSTIKAAIPYAADQAAAAGLISVEVATITEGVLTAMFLSKVKVASVVLLIAIGTLLGTGTLVLSVSPAQEKDDQEKNAVPVAAGLQEMLGEATASEVGNAYGINDALGDAKFTGKRVRVTGLWQAVRRVKGRFVGADHDYVLTMPINSNTRLTFRFVSPDPKKTADGPDFQKQLAELKSGQVLTIEGRCEGRTEEDELRGVIVFDDCKIISVKPPRRQAEEKGQKPGQKAGEPRRQTLIPPHPPSTVSN
jgi:hypothetical protein